MKKFLISIQNDRKIKSEFIFDIYGDTIYSIIFNNDTYNFILKRICGKELINFTIKKNLMVYFDNLIYIEIWQLMRFIINLYLFHYYPNNTMLVFCY